MRRKGQRGFTLVEAVIGISIAALILPGVALALQFLIEVPSEESALLAVSNDVNLAAEWIANDANQAEEFFEPADMDETDEEYYGKFTWTDDEGKGHEVLYYYSDHSLFRKEEISWVEDEEVKYEESTHVIVTNIANYADMSITLPDENSKAKIKLVIKCTDYDGSEPMSKEGIFHMILRKGILSSEIPSEGLFPYRVPIDIDHTQNDRTVGDYQVSVTFDQTNFRYDHLGNTDGDDLRFYAAYDIYPQEIPINITGSTVDLIDYPVKVDITDYGLLRNMNADGSDLRFYLNPVEELDDAWAEPYTGLNYWIESFSNSRALVWVKVDSIPTTGTKIYMYYGNPDASSESDGQATLDIFDEFDDEALGGEWTWLTSAGGAKEPATWDEGGSAIDWLHIRSDGNTEFKEGQDNGHGIYQWVSGDFEFSTKVSGHPKKKNHQSGLMVRQDDENFFKFGYGSKTYTFLFWTWIYRGIGLAIETDNVMTELYGETDSRCPKYLKVKRIGNSWTGWYKDDDTPWEKVASWNQDLADPVMVGIGVTDGNNSTPYECDFDWFMIRPYHDPEPTVDMVLEPVSEELNICDYYIEKWPANTTAWQEGEDAVVWLKVPAIPANSVQTVYMYYGNEAASPESDSSGFFEMYDNFDDGVLGDEWNWYDEPGDDDGEQGGGEGGGSWSESGGSLHVTSETMTDFCEDQNNGNGVYQWVSGDFEIEIDMTTADPWKHMQQAGVIVAQDEDNYIKFGYGGRYLVTWPWYMLYRTGVGLFREEANTQVALDPVTDDGSHKFLKLRRIGDYWNASYSEDGINWTTQEDWGWMQVLNDPVRVGIGVADGNSNSNFSASFDYINIRKITDPEPSGRLIKPYEVSVLTSSARYDYDDIDLEDATAFEELSEFESGYYTLVSAPDNDRASHGHGVYLCSARYDNDDDILEPATTFDTLNEFSEDCYTAVAQSDNNRAELDGAIGDKVQHVFRFKTLVPSASISSLNVLWEGRSTGSPPEVDGIRVWDNATSSWEAIGDITSSESEVSKSFTEDVANYIDADSYIYLVACAENETGNATLYTDYVALDVIDLQGQEWNLAHFGNKVQHVFQFEIEESVADINDINVVWEGYCNSVIQVGGVMIWNNTNGGFWEEAGDVPIVENEVSVSYKGDIGDYIDGSNHIYLMAYAEDESQPVILYTDYLRVTVTSKIALISISGEEEIAPGQ